MPQHPYLNGAYYDPPIRPAPPKTFYRPSPCTSSCCCCCDCLFGCGCCLLSCILKIIFAILVIIGLIVLAFWLIVRPHEVKFHTSNAVLTQFNLSSNTGTADTLHYNLALNLTIRNPNNHIGIYYDNIEVRGYYNDQRFGYTSVSPFYQGHKDTTTVGPVTMTGQSLVVLSSGQISDFGSQKSDGVFDITVKLYLKVRAKLGWVKIGKFKPKVECDLHVPLSSSGKSFQTTRCKYDL
ncbi:yls9-like [Ancistrocladus abbreviatus]